MEEGWRAAMRLSPRHLWTIWEKTWEVEAGVSELKQRGTRGKHHGWHFLGVQQKDVEVWLRRAKVLQRALPTCPESPPTQQHEPSTIRLPGSNPTLKRMRAYAALLVETRDCLHCSGSASPSLVFDTRFLASVTNKLNKNNDLLQNWLLDLMETNSIQKFWEEVTMIFAELNSISMHAILLHCWLLRTLSELVQRLQWSN